MMFGSLLRGLGAAGVLVCLAFGCGEARMVEGREARRRRASCIVVDWRLRRKNVSGRYRGWLKLNLMLKSGREMMWNEIGMEKVCKKMVIVAAADEEIGTALGEYTYA